VRLAIAIVLAVVAPGPAFAQETANSTMPYKVKKDDTLPILAAEFYGDHNKQIFIMIENGMVHPRPLKQGERLRIPISREIFTAPGDNFRTLAQTYLGDSKRARYLADYNGMAVEDTIAAGTQLLVPFSVTYVASGTETLASISLALFGDASYADKIQEYNNLEKTTLEKGEKALVPVFNVRLRADKMPPVDRESTTRRDRKREAAARAANAIPTARTAWRNGDYAAVKAALAEIDIDYLDTAAAVDVGLLLGAVHVAYDDLDLATATFKRVLDRKRNLVLRAFDFSPKILAVWKKAGGLTE
jgi:LysM domain-containing protein